MQGNVWAGICAAAALTCLSAPAVAAERVRDCGYRFDADVTLEADRVRLVDGSTRFELHDGGIDRNGRALALAPAQRSAARAYRDELVALVPAVTDLAWHGAALGIQTLAIVGAALGNDVASLERIIARAETLALRVHHEFDGRHLDKGHVFADSGLDTEIARLATDAGASLAGGIASMIAAAVFDPQAARARGEFLQRLVERRIEPRADALANDADRLCAQLRRMDALEAQLGVVDIVHRDDTI